MTQNSAQNNDLSHVELQPGLDKNTCQFPRNPSSAVSITNLFCSKFLPRGNHFSDFYVHCFQAFQKIAATDMPMS